jgi:DNA-binding transcriptional LysR family regulator
LASLVETGAVDLAFAGETDLPNPSPAGTNPLICWEFCYELDYFLVTPRNHPLARRKRIEPRELVTYPLVNGPDSINDRAFHARMKKYGLFPAKTRRIATRSASAVRRYVEMGFGIGLVTGKAGHTTNPLLHERNVSHIFGRFPIYILWRNGIPLSKAARQFADTVKAQLNPISRAHTKRTHSSNL